jgi:hypothetical protein
LTNSTPSSPGLLMSVMIVRLLSNSHSTVLPAIVCNDDKESFGCAGAGVRVVSGLSSTTRIFLVIYAVAFCFSRLNDQTVAVL